MRRLWLLLILLLATSSNLGARETFGIGPIGDFQLSAALGNVRHVSQDFVIGVGSDLGPADGFVTIWDSNFNLTRITTPTEVFINSTDAADDQQFLVQGLDSDFNRLDTIVTVSGQTQVSVATVMHVQSVTLLVGELTPAGDVYVARSSTLTAGVPLDTDVLSKVIQGENITHNGFFMVPAGEAAVTVAIRGSTNQVNSAVTIQTLISPFGSTVFLKTLRYTFVNGLQILDFPAPVASANILGQLSPVLDQKSFIEWRALASKGGTEVFLGSDFFLIDRDYIGLANPTLNL